MDLKEHAQKHSKKWKFPLNRQEGIKIYKSFIKYEYWMNINTLEKIALDKNNWKKNLLLEKSPTSEYIKGLKDTDKFFDLALTKRALTDFSILKLRFLEGQIEGKEISKNAYPNVDKLCSRERILKINDALKNKKEVFTNLLENIYGHIYFYNLNLSLCYSYKFELIEEYLDNLNSLLN